MILAINEEKQSFKKIGWKRLKMVKRVPRKSHNQRKILSLFKKIDDTLDYSNKLKRALKKNKNLEVLEGVVSDTQAYLNTVKRK